MIDKHENFSTVFYGVSQDKHQNYLLKLVKKVNSNGYNLNWQFSDLKLIKPQHKILKIS